MGGLVFSVFQIKPSFILWITGLTILCSSLRADLGVEDPTRPIYEQPIDLSSFENGDANQEENASSDIPPLSQLVFSKNRQIAMFGDLIVRAGDDTDFGKVIAIRQDRVLIELKGQIQEVIFSLEEPLEASLEESTEDSL